MAEEDGEGDVGREFFDDAGGNILQAEKSEAETSDFEMLEFEGDTWLFASPDSLGGEAPSRIRRRWADRNEDIGLDPLEGLYDDIEELIEDIREIRSGGGVGNLPDFEDMTQTELLREIAKSSYLSNRMQEQQLRVANQLASFMNNVMALQTQQLSTMFSILEIQEPYFGMSVTGVRTVQNSNSKVLVVPETDRIDIPTRTLVVRAQESNNSKIWIGDEDVGVNAGYSLKPGEQINLPVDIKAMELYMVSNKGGDAVEIMGFV